MKPEALLQIASKQLRDLLADKLVVGDLAPSEYELRETTVVLPGFPLPKGVILVSQIFTLEDFARFFWHKQLADAICTAQRYWPSAAPRGYIQIH